MLPVWSLMLWASVSPSAYGDKASRALIGVPLWVKIRRVMCLVQGQAQNINHHFHCSSLDPSMVISCLDSDHHSDLPASFWPLPVRIKHHKHQINISNAMSRSCFAQDSPPSNVPTARGPAWLGQGWVTVRGPEFNASSMAL